MIKRVNWHDGLHLSAEIFDNQDLYYNSLIKHAAQALNPHYWGFSELNIDSQQLVNGVLVITSAIGVFRDGEYFNIKNLKNQIETNEGNSLVYVCRRTDKKKEIGLNYIEDSYYLSSNTDKADNSIACCRIKHSGNPTIDQIYIPALITINSNEQLINHITSTYETLKASGNHEYTTLEKELAYFMHHLFSHPSLLHAAIFKSYAQTPTYTHNNLHNCIINPLNKIHDSIKQDSVTNKTAFIKESAYWICALPHLNKDMTFDILIKTTYQDRQPNLKISSSDDIDDIVKFSLKSTQPEKIKQLDLETWQFTYQRCQFSSISKQVAIHINDEILLERPMLCI